MGAHPAAPSSAHGGGRSVALEVLIGSDPQAMLGPRVLASFGARLPYLAKFLAAAKPLSIQVHPNALQAREGFNAEQEHALPLSATGRNYRDPFHKPELVYALTRFDLMSGLREPEQSAKLIEELEVPGLEPLVSLLHGSTSAHAEDAAFAWLLEQRGVADAWVEQVAEVATLGGGGRPEHAVIQTLAAQFPGDPGVVAPLLLNYVRLEAGQAVFTGAGVIHAYLNGLAIEVMASSDNVIRAGLTAKHVDVPELMRITGFEPGLPGVIAPLRPIEGVLTYEPPVDEFALSVVTARGGAMVGGPVDGPRIAIAVEGVVELRAADTLRLEPGESAFVPHIDGPLSVSGNGTVVVVHA